MDDPENMERIPISVQKQPFEHPIQDIIRILQSELQHWVLVPTT